MFYFIFILLAVQWSTTCAEKKIACEHHRMEIECPAGKQINVVYANYGRTAPGDQVCHTKNVYHTNCVSPGSSDRIKSECNRRRKCSIYASNSIFGDPCVRTEKYAEVEYTCVEGIEKKIACEHHRMEIECPAGKQINIVYANYGRTAPGDQVCHTKNVYHTNCVSPGSSDRIKSACNSRQKCSVYASNSVFGDPCVRTEKYAEVDFTCVGETTVTACEGKDLTIECPAQQHIQVSTANYGRTVPGIALCPQSGNDANIYCYAANSNDIAKKKCNNQNKCVIPSNNSVFGDPCFLTYKYLEVTYKCVQDNTMYACEGSSLSLSCPAGELLHIIDANYGRIAPGSSLCPMKNIDSHGSCRASSSNNVVGTKCNGQQACTLQASNGVFGDPCVGIYKYLEVKYRCKPINP